MSKVIVVVLIFVLVVTPLSILGQTPPTQQVEDKLVTGTTEVVFDAVVKDKKGRPVKDLHAEDFQITEDGVPQEVKSFRLVAGDTPDSTASPGEKAAVAGPKGKARVLEAFNAGRIGTVALVFDRLSADSRTRSHDAAIAYVGNGLGQNDFIGVFGIDQTLSVIQTFTNDDKLIKQAIDKAGVASSTTPSTDRSQITDLMQRDVSLTSQVNQAEASAASSQNIGNLAALEMDKVLNDVSLRAAQGFERMEQTEQGRATTEGLLAIIAAMGNLPGRKALLFFSEGVSIPAAVAANFRTVISNANRANVAIYAVDAAGLRATSADIESGRQMTALGQQRAAQAASSGDTFNSMMRDSEKNEELVRHNPEGVLGQLANETGGLLVSGTNNPGPRLRQVNDDLHSYYVLTYAPKNSNYDGKFRQINVKVKRSGVDVQSRKGYYAVGARYDTPVMAFEAPALALLGRSQPNAFESRIGAFSFPDAGNRGLLPILVDDPGGNINFVSDTE
jgi:VWFA-related protein